MKNFIYKYSEALLEVNDCFNVYLEVFRHFRKIYENKIWTGRGSNPRPIGLLQSPMPWEYSTS